MSAVGTRSTLHGSLLLRPLAVDRLRRPVVGDRGRHQDDVRVVAGQGLAAQIGGGRRRHDLDPFGRRDLEVRREQRHGRATVACRLGERDAHAAGRAVPEEPHGVERLAGPAGGDEHAAAGERPRRRRRRRASASTRRAISSGSLIRPVADEALRELAVLGADDHGAARGEQLEVRPRRGVLPHRGVHRRRDEQRAAVRERGLGEEVVREPVREPRERVRRERRDDEQVGVLEVRVRVGRRMLARERPERLGRDEPLGPARHDRRDVVPGPHEQPHELAGLVGRDAAGHSEEDSRHADSVPASRRPRYGKEAVRPRQRAPSGDVPRRRRGSSRGIRLLPDLAWRNRQCDRDSGRLQRSARPKTGIKPRDSASAESRLASRASSVRRRRTSACRARSLPSPSSGSSSSATRRAAAERPPARDPRRAGGGSC